MKILLLFLLTPLVLQPQTAPEDIQITITISKSKNIRCGENISIPLDSISTGPTKMY